MNNIGIWLDKEKAHLVRLTDDGETLETLRSDVEFFNLKSSSQSRVKWGGPQDVVHESTYLEREKHQLKAYFASLASAIDGADAIAIFGPANVGEAFRKELLGHHKQIAAKVMTVEKTDSMTDNQVKALVRNYFKTVQ